MRKNIETVIKRDGRTVKFTIDKISEAISKANVATGNKMSEEDIYYVSDVTVARLLKNGLVNPTVEQIQDNVESVLIAEGFEEVAKCYIIYRAQRTQKREMNNTLMQKMHELTFADAKDSDDKRENANVNGDTPMGIMLKYGSTAAKEYDKLYVLEKEASEAHEEGDIHIHDMDFYTMTTTCTQIDLSKLYKNGFNTGHGFLRQPKSIMSYSSLAAIAIQANQNDQHGGQAIPAFDYMMAPGIRYTYRKKLVDNLALYLMNHLDLTYDNAISKAKDIINDYEKTYGTVRLEQETDIKRVVSHNVGSAIDKEIDNILTKALRETDRECYQAMESFIHNLNTMHSRAGAQVPFSSINYGTDTSPEGQMVIKNVLLAQEAGLGNNETPIFPIHIFKVKEGVNYNPSDPNYDLFKLACRVSAKRLFPNFSFLDAPFNLAYYKEGNPETEVGYMGCRTRVMGNVNGPETTYSRGNLSFTSINLPRLGIEAKGNIKSFFEALDNRIELCIRQLLHRYKIQCSRKVKNFPFLMGQGVWMNSGTLKPDDTLEEVLKHGSLTVGFIGLAECLTALIGKHHGESSEAQSLGLNIVEHMRNKMDEATKKYGLNFALIATPAEGLSGRFVRLDRKKYGSLDGITDKDYYCNSFHVPPSYKISAYDKIKKEAPYHNLTNGGHISYIELDGNPEENLEAFEKVVRCMKDNNIGYGAINHPVDRDPCCGYTGIIEDECPKCHRKENEWPDGEHNGIPFDRIRRITGYLVGTLDRFNNAKRAEVEDRTKHNV